MMREFPHMNSVVDALRYDTGLVDFFEEQREHILQKWLDYPVLGNIVDTLGYTLEEYRSKIATGVMNNFLKVLNGDRQPGDCPVMRSIINEFYEMGLTVEDVFMSCTALKNVLVQFLEECGVFEMKKHAHNVMMVLDHNLYGVLSIYSEMKCASEVELDFRNRIIQENVLYSRTGTDGVILETTEAFCKLSGYEKEELIGKTHAMLRHPESDPDIYRELWETITAGEIWNGSLANVRKNGSTFITKTRIVPVYDEGGEITEYMAFRNDITADELAKVDPLTGLYNRRELDTIFRNLHFNAVAKTEALSVILADIDHFKSINDTYGHYEGDDVIVRFAGILRTCTRSSDVCARWGGEEFIILLPGTDLATARGVAERIRQSVQNCLQVRDRKITCSFGIAQMQKGEGTKELFKRADGYLYRAKENGRNQSVSE
jgi:diguanylate cyclase (GGDEF)-like protein/PAS domain S-box-containing protein